MDKVTDSKKLRECIRILERKLGILEKSEFSCNGISLAQCHAIVEIGRAGILTLVQLSELFSLDNSTMSRTVNNLVTSGHAKREIDPEDRRYVTISLTEEGNRVFNEIEDSMNQYFNHVFNNIPENKKLQVTESLEILLDAIGKSKCC